MYKGPNILRAAAGVCGCVRLRLSGGFDAPPRRRTQTPANALWLKYVRAFASGCGWLRRCYLQSDFGELRLIIDSNKCFNMLSEKPVQLWLSSSLLFQPIKNGKIRIVNAIRDVFSLFLPHFILLAFKSLFDSKRSNHKKQIWKNLMKTM